MIFPSIRFAQILKNLYSITFGSIRKQKNSNPNRFESPETNQIESIYSCITLDFRLSLIYNQVAFTNTVVFFLECFLLRLQINKIFSIHGIPALLNSIEIVNINVQQRQKHDMQYSVQLFYLHLHK
jgi:hypothetical protein